MSGIDPSAAFAPLLPWPVLAAFAAASALIVGYGFYARAAGMGWRLATVAVLLLALANPSLVLEQRNALSDVAFAVIDDSPSQDIGDRRERSERALAQLRAALKPFPDVELRVVRAGAARQGRDGTLLFGDLGRALADVPDRRLAGVVMITDGQVHDVPTGARQRTRFGPVHALITGDRERGDRRLVIERAPSFGLVGKPLTMSVRAEDLPGGGRGPAWVTIRRDGKPWRRLQLPLGHARDVEFELDHAGPTFFELEVEAAPEELSRANNTAVVAVNGVRDRLRVLLISGEPHPGERAWRNLLKSDPAVDLVHFTILRPPEKQDRTPVNQLSLISFPTRELFEARLDEFDLIIFDRYRRRGVILSRYIDNIARYVERGGALLVAVGPSFATRLSLYRTPLQPILPGKPSGKVLVGGFRAAIADAGRRHPVTAGLAGAAGAPKWGRWFRQIDSVVDRGDLLMTGAENKPLLILDRVGEGRVAQFMSDQIWLWSRGFEGGGPQVELLRRLAHWLMKEPELEEDALTAEVRGGRIEIARRSLLPEGGAVEVETPSGKVRSVELGKAERGRATGSIVAEEPGLYRVRDHRRATLVAVGTLNPREVADPRATDEHLEPIVSASGGGVIWLARDAFPEIRRVRPGREAAGSNRLGRQSWIGLRVNGDYVVAGIREVPLLPGLLVLAAALAALALAWRREGRR
jgi:hypothetical protein